MANMFISYLKVIKKYGFATIIVASIPFTVPYIEKYFYNEQARVVDRIITRSIERNREVVFEKVDKRMQIIINEIRDRNSDVIASLCKTGLNTSQAINVMKNAVGYQSIHKLDWIKSFMRRGINNKEYAKSEIKAELIRQSAVYIVFLNEFTHHELGKLGDYVAEHFPMDEFIHSVNSIVLDETIEMEERLSYIMSTMLTLQNNLWEKAKKDANAR